MPTTVQDAIQFFSDEDRCIAYLVAQRWPNGVTCPICGSADVLYLKNQRRWKCRVAHERRQFSVKVGTLMEDSPIPLTKWLPVMWMIACGKNGMSSYEIAREIGITQKSAWFMMHRVHLAMDGERDAVSRYVEAEETIARVHARLRALALKEVGVRQERLILERALMELQALS